MFSAWVLGLWFLFHPHETADLLQIEQDGKPVAHLSREEFQLPLGGVPLVDEAKLRMYARKLESVVYRPPINATMDEQGRIIPETKGQTLNQFAFIQQFYTYFYGQGPMRTDQVYQVVHPKVDRALMEQVRQKKIGHYTTFFNPHNTNRSHNIWLAARAINNYVVLPGETFSFNLVVGKRTREKGYLQAPVIVKGELSEGIGGGICQVSSTLYNAVDRAGLHIVKRYSHSRHVPYVPPGRDATVSWYGPDFVFQNKYPYPILIRAKSQHGRMMVTIHSFPEMEHEPRNVPSASTEWPEENAVQKNSTE